MTDLRSFRAVIELWPSKEAMASDLGVNSWNVSKWWQRDSIPAEYWSRLIATKRSEDAGISAVLLTGLAARESAEVRA